MSLLSKLVGLKHTQPAARVRICVECGMPVDEHKDWCSILRIRQAMEQKRHAAATAED